MGCSSSDYIDGNKCGFVPRLSAVGGTTGEVTENLYYASYGLEK